MTLLRAWHLCLIPPKIGIGMYKKVVFSVGLKITTMYIPICVFGGIGETKHMTQAPVVTVLSVVFLNYENGMN